MDQITHLNELSGASRLTVIDRLRKESEKSETFSAVMHTFAVRQRARQQVTIHRLKVAMSEEGWDLSKKQLEDVLQVMASCHLGTLERDKKGRIRALKGIKYTLQSIGMAAIAKQETLDKYSTPTRFIKLPAQQPPMVQEDYASVVPKASMPLMNPIMKSREYGAYMVLVIEGKELKFDMPKKVTLEQFLAILKGV